MENIINKTFRLRDTLTGDIEETLYKVIMVEEDNEIPGLVWIYLESEFGDENIEFEPRYNFYYSKITNNEEGLLV